MQKHCFQNFTCDKPSLGNGCASFPSSCVHATCMAHQAIGVLVAYGHDWPNCSLLEYQQVPLL